MEVANTKRLLIPLIVIVALALSAPAASAYFSQPLDVKWHGDQSDAIYKVRVISAVKSDVFVDPRLAAYAEGLTSTAGAEIIAPIKGMARGKIEIVWPASLPMSGYATLTAGKTYLVFLKGASSPYQFTNPRDSAMEVPAGAVKYAYGSGTYDRLLAELLRAAGSQDAGMKRQSIEQLGKLGDIRAADLLKKLSASEDISTKGASLISRIQIGDPPSIDQLIPVLRLDSSEFPSRLTMAMGSSSGRSTAGKEQAGLIEALERSVQANWFGDYKPQKQLKGFDYIAFITAALKCDVIVQNDVLRTSLAGTLRSLADPKSVTILLKLLDDPSKQVRYLAATGFAAIAEKKDYYVSADKFDADEATHVNYWKAWAAEHPEGR